MGCIREDMFALDKRLQVKLVAIDALGNTLWDINEYKSQPKITVPCHNNHAWANIPTDPPKILEVYGLDATTESALAKILRETKLGQETIVVQKPIDQKT